MVQDKPEKPKINLEKLVGQFKVKIALSTKNPSAMLYALNEYPYTPNIYSDPREDPVNAIKSTLKSGEIDKTTDFHCNGLAKIYDEFIEEKANINNIKYISEKLGYKVPDISNLVSGDINLGKLKKEYRFIERKLEDNKDYKLNKKEFQTVEAYETIKGIMNLYEQKTLMNVQETLLTDKIKERNENYKPVEKTK